MDIALSFDSGYVMPSGVAIASICDSNEGCDLHFHLFVNGVSEVDKAKIMEVVDGRAQVTFYDVDVELLSQCPINPQIHSNSIAKYFRLLIPSLVDEGIERILYLDGDILVRRNLSELFDMDMQGRTIAMVYDKIRYDTELFNRLRYEREYGYFNSGVCLMNTKQWRERGCTQTIFDYIAENSSILTWEDQDALNRVFAGDCLALPFMYNVQEYMFYEDESYIYWKDSQLLHEARHTPVVVHMCGVKPWNYNCNHPYTADWFEVLAKTPWRGYVAKTPSLKRRFIDGVKLFLSKRVNFSTGHINFLSKFEG
ncbi:MAG: glycosyltransferase family 8 protein [Rikenellaceae bacterium]